MPGYGAGASLEERLPALVTRTAVHEVYLRVSLGRSRCRVDVMTAKVATVLEGISNGEVGKILAAEGDNLALGDEAGELILAGGVEGGELDAPDLGADGGSEIGDGGGVFGEEVGEGSVGVFAMLVMLKLLEGRVLLIWVPCGKIVGVLTTLVNPPIREVKRSL